MRLSYGIDDDEAAYDAVGNEVNTPDTARWRAMTTGDDRAQQTYRILGLLVSRTEATIVQRKSELRAFQGTRTEYRSANVEHQLWKSRAVHFLDNVVTRRAELKDRVKQLRQRDALDQTTCDLRALTAAVTDHRDAIKGDPKRLATTADRLLWARLDLLTGVDRSSGSADAPRA